jgi:TnpA family transposase
VELDSRDVFLWRLVGTVRERSNERGWLLVAGHLSEVERERLLGLLLPAGGEGEPPLDRLRRGPVKPTAEGVVDALMRLQELQVLAPELTDLEELAFARVRTLMIDARTRRVGDLQDLRELRRAATLAAFATITEQAARDEVLGHFLRVLDDIETRAAARLKAKRLKGAPAIDTAALRLADAAAVILDETIADPQVRSEILARLGREPLRQAVEEIRKLVQPAEEGHREQMLGAYTTVRRFLPLLLNTVEFQCTDAGEPAVGALRALRQALAESKPLAPSDLPLELVSRAWRRLVAPMPGKIDRRAYTFWALEQLREGLHRRDVFIARSGRWGDPRTILLDDRSWQVSKPETCRSLQLPERPGEFISQLQTELDAAYERTRRSLGRENPIFEVAEGRLDLEKLDALEVPDSLIWLRSRQHAMIPDAELPDVLLEIAARTRFMEAFTHAREPSAQLQDLEISIIAVLISQACNVGWTPLINESIPALSADRLKWVARHYIRPETLIPANARIVEVHSKLWLPELWGGGEVASIDGMRFVVPYRTFHARFNRRYFHRRRRITVLGTTADHYAGIHTIVVPGTQPDWLYLLDGLLDPQTSVQPRQIVTDTAGYTDIVFGLFRLLGYQFSPRLADTGGVRFWRIDPHTDYGRLNRIATNRIDTQMITAHYDDILRIAGSLLQRATTASDLMRALRSHTRHLATLGQAIAQIGRVPKTIHCLDYSSDPNYRRPVIGQLNRGEGRHNLCRDVFHGRQCEMRQPYREGMEEQIGALGLVANCIILYNTLYAQRVIEKLRADGHQITDEDLRRLSPLLAEHINLVGRYHIALAEAILRGEYRPLKGPALIDAAGA